jgi:hypothetical protein
VEYCVRPFYGRFQRIEVFGSISDDLIHEGQSLNGSSFHHIDNYAPHDTLQFLQIGQSIHHSASDRATE